MNLALKKFDITSISSDKVVVFIGKRNTGKSFLVKDLLYYHKHVPIGTVISATEEANPFYGHMIPSLFIHNKYTPEIVANSLKRQKMVIRKLNKDKNKFGSSNNIPPNKLNIFLYSILSLPNICMFKFSFSIFIREFPINEYSFETSSSTFIVWMPVYLETKSLCKSNNKFDIIILYL